MTVSQVLNPRKSSVRVSKATAEKIHETAKRLNYRPNLIARQLAEKRNNIIGIIIDSQAPVLWRRVMMKIEENATQNGFRIQIGLVHNSLESIKRYINDFVAYGINNIICVSHDYPEFREIIPPLFKIFPNVVFINKPYAYPEASYVSPDYDAIFRKSFEYLLRIGCKRIVTCANIRLNKVHADVFKERNLLWNDKFIIRVAQITRYEHALEFIDKVLLLKPDALIVGSDEAAMWCCRVLNEKGFAIPDDISILSTSKWPVGEAFKPAITAIDYDYETIAKKAVDIIMENSKAGDERKIRQYKELIPGQLIVMESCRR